MMAAVILKVFYPAFQSKCMVGDISFAFDEVKKFRNGHPTEGCGFALLQSDGVFVTGVDRQKTVIKSPVGIISPMVKRDKRIRKKSGLFQ